MTAGWLLWTWLGLAFVFLAFAIGKSREYGALTLAYFLGLSLFHVPGVLAYLDPLGAPGSVEVTETGFELTLIGIASYTVGAIVSRRFGQRSNKKYGQPRVSTRSLNNLGWRLAFLGILTYFVVLPASKFLPSFTAAVSAVSTLLIVGLWIRIYGAVITRNAWGVLSTYAVLPALPVATLVTAGFIGYGIYWVLSIIAFHYVIARNRAWFYIATPLVIIAGLSLFVTYAGERSSIREAVWVEKAPLSERFDRVAKLVTNFQFLDLSNPDHVQALDGRLNQNYFVGLGAIRYQNGVINLKWGTTVPVWGFIPRALWPNKPPIGGGGKVVGEFTGLELDLDTSWGAGQVLEFYANFALPGVIIGFFGMGFLLMYLDRRIMRALATGDKRSLLLHAMPGLVLLKPEGNLIEIIVALVASLVAARIVLFIEKKNIATVAPQPPQMRPLPPRFSR